MSDTPITDSIFAKLTDEELFLINELYISNQEKDKEIERLNNIIKEAREYIKKETKELYNKNRSCKYLGEIMQLEFILEILDKGE